MILVSCRHGFDSPQCFGPRLIREYPHLPDTTQWDGMLTDADLVTATRAKHVLVLVHGYHNTLANVANAYGQLDATLHARGIIGPHGYDVLVGFLWPGFQTSLGFFPAIPWANRAAGHLRDLLTLMASAATIDIQTHSLGARVGLQALAFGGEVFVDNLMLTAPAVDDEVLEPTKEFHAAMMSCRRCLVYHSAHDPVLQTAYRLAEWDCALGWRGPQDPAVIAADCADVFTIDCAQVVTTHGGYRSAAAVLDHWGRVLTDVPLPRLERL